MSQIIPISVGNRAIDGEQQQTVNARELHIFLECKIRFNDWIKKRIADYWFQEGIDFVRMELQAGMKMSESGGAFGGIDSAQKNVAVESMGYSGFGQQGRIEYAITLDMAKELAMVERNEKGKQARQYFIACERRAKLLAKAVQIPQSLPEALRLAADEAERRVAAEARLAIVAPKAKALDRIATADGSLCVTDAAKTLQMKPRELFNWLSGNHWIYRRTGSPNWIAYQNRIQSGYLEHKVTTVERSDGSEKVAEQVRMTPKGLAKVAEDIRLSQTV